MFKSFSLAFVAIFVALDIIGGLPLYASMTRSLAARERKHVVDISMFVAGAVALVFVFLGQTIFRSLGITIFDFRIAGGLVLLLVSLADLLSGPDAVKPKASSPSTVGIVPLAVPLITGPGVLTTLVLQVGSFGYAITVLAMLVNYVLAWFLLRRAEKITGWVGKDGTVVASKIAALLLAAIAVSMIRAGVFEAITVFRGVQ